MWKKKKKKKKKREYFENQKRIKTKHFVVSHFAFSFLSFPKNILKQGNIKEIK